MQPTNKPSRSQISRCIYCGATTRGKGCRYGPHGVHFHPDDPKRCAYCGSTNYGRGCKVNPTSDVHLHGINFNTMFKEQVIDFVKTKFLVNELKKPFSSFKAYKLKLIDENGNKLKNATTVEEQAAFTAYTKTILKLKKYLGPKIDLLEASNNLQENSVVFDNIEQYKKLLVVKDKIDENINQLFCILDEAHQEGLSADEIYKLINA